MGTITGAQSFIDYCRDDACVVRDVSAQREKILVRIADAPCVVRDKDQDPRDAMSATTKRQSGPFPIFVKKTEKSLSQKSGISI